MFDRLIDSPAVFDFIQRVAGKEAILATMRPWLRSVSGVVLDVGGGTGPLAAELGAQAQYRCLDLEPLKLGRLKGRGVVGDSTQLPIRSHSVDTAILWAVSHHLDDRQFTATLHEIVRVLKCGGELVFLDQVRTTRVTGRLLWALDRGDYPRTRWQLLSTIRSVFDVTARVEFSVYHDYLALRVRRRCDD